MKKRIILTEELIYMFNYENCVTQKIRERLRGKNATFQLHLIIALATAHHECSIMIDSMYSDILDCIQGFNGQPGHHLPPGVLSPHPHSLPAKPSNHVLSNHGYISQVREQYC